MSSSSTGYTLLAAALVLMSQACVAQTDLTPIGAERAGNKDNTIPAWTGGAVTPPAGWRPGQSRPDAYADEKPSFVIDASNVDRHADKLTAGQVQLVKSTKGYRMDVYPTHRSCGFPQHIYDRTKAFADHAQLSEDGTRMTRGKTAAVPFVTPKSGVEVMWNNKLRFYGEGFTWKYYTVIPPANGQGLGEFLVSDEYIMFPMASAKNEDIQGAKGIDMYYLSPTVAPPQIAGDVTLVHSSISKPADIWLYFASQRRVRRAPTYQFDAPVMNTENLITSDSYAMFNGSLERYDFKLAGKRELIVPYNWLKVNVPTTNVASVAGPKFMNRDLARYETHRVWVVEATIKAGLRHTFPKRTFYIDEDTWAVVVQDLFDGQGKVQRVMESGPMPVWDIQACASMAYTSHDLASGRVYIDRFPVGPKGVDWMGSREGRVKESMFEPDDLRRFTTR